MDLILYTLRTVAYAIVEPTHILVLVILGVMFYLKNKKVSLMQRMTIGEIINSPLELTLSQIVMGILAGVISSVLLTVFGVTFGQNSGIELIFMFSLLLMFFKKRFICFSYSGAALGFLSIIITYLSNIRGTESFLNINILSLMTFIAILHIVEAFLVMIDGGRGAVPVFTSKDNKIIGGFSLNRYWALPVAVFIIFASSQGGGTATINTPDWWPIINRNETLALLATAVITSIPFYGMIGYSAITFTMDKKTKPISSGIGILAYGVSLLAIAQLTRIGIVGEIIVLIYAPLGHELMIMIQKKIEEKGKYLYYSGDDGIAILDVSPTSPAYIAGIRRGDKIIGIGDNDVISEVDIIKAIKDSTFDIIFKVKKISGEIMEYSVKPKDKRIGVLLVPRMVSQKEVVAVDSDEFKDILEELKNKK